MGISPIEIFKKLPKTNCGDCGVHTCMAFAVMLTQGKAELSACPHVDAGAAEELSASSQPPVLNVTVGAGDKAFKSGGETVIFRHEKTFVNPTGIAVLVTDAMDDAAIEARIKAANELQYERVGINLRADLIAVKSDDPAKLAAMAKKADSGAGLPVMLVSEKVDALKAAGEAIKDKKPLLYAATDDNVDDVIALAKELDCPVAAKGKDLDNLVALTEKMAAAGLKQVFIDGGAREIKQVFQDQVQIRRQAIKKTFRPLGFPTIVWPCEMTDDPMKEALYAAIGIVKYAGPGAADERLHRPAKTNGHRARRLRLQRPRRQSAAAGHLELLPHILHRLRRTRDLENAIKANRHRHRGAKRAHRLGVGKVRRRPDRARHLEKRGRR